MAQLVSRRTKGVWGMWQEQHVWQTRVRSRAPLLALPAAILFSVIVLSQFLLRLGWPMLLWGPLATFGTDRENEVCKIHIYISKVNWARNLIFRRPSEVRSRPLLERREGATIEPQTSENQATTRPINLGDMCILLISFSSSVLQVASYRS